ncbi:MAG: type II toxin-antitoxin system PemK/MazF family toxin [Deltaproteobacteria bacterium]|nr:type II toxin-antitoxin system PemK/MazF family toxin [Deltaproteobacteria bacterium]
MVRPQQGDIYWVKFGRVGDSGPSGKRPAIVIQNDLLNISNIQTTVVSLITSNKKLGEIPGNVTLRKGLGNIPKTSIVVVSQVATVDKARLLEKIGELDKKTIERILKGCQMVISSSIF